jgi:hypothetical protein
MTRQLADICLQYSLYSHFVATYSFSNDDPVAIKVVKAIDRYRYMAEQSPTAHTHLILCYPTHCMLAYRFTQLVPPSHTLVVAREAAETEVSILTDIAQRDPNRLQYAQPLSLYMRPNACDHHVLHCCPALSIECLPCSAH